MGAGANIGHCLSGYHSYFPSRAGGRTAPRTTRLQEQRRHEPHRAALRRGGRPRGARQRGPPARHPRPHRPRREPRLRRLEPAERPVSADRAPLVRALRGPRLVQHPIPERHERLREREPLGHRGNVDVEPRRLLVRSDLRISTRQTLGRRHDHRPRHLADGAVRPRRVPRRRGQAGEQRPLRRHAVQAQRRHLDEPPLLHGGRGARRRRGQRHGLRRRTCSTARWTTRSTTRSSGPILQGDSNAGTDLDNGLISDESTWTGVTPSALMGHFFGSHDTARAISLANGDDVGDPGRTRPRRRRRTPPPSAASPSPTPSSSRTTRSRSSGWATSSDSPARSIPTAAA